MVSLGFEGGIATSCVRCMVEGCAVASVLGMLEERESAACGRVEGLREEVARLAEVLEVTEIELDSAPGNAVDRHVTGT